MKQKKNIDKTSHKKELYDLQKLKNKRFSPIAQNFYDKIFFMEILGLLFFIILMYYVMKQALSKLGLEIKSTSANTSDIFSPLTHLFSLLFGLTENKGLMSSYEKSKKFSSFNKGLLLDGKNKRLSEGDSYKHLLLVSRTGGGKTSSYVIPNIFKLAETKNSMVITDISGELYEKTSGYLAQKGYKIYVLNPENLEESIGYNPLHYCNNSIDIDELSTLLIKSNKEQSNFNGENEYWESGAKSIISLIMRLLLLRDNPNHKNLANVKYLLNKFGTNGEDLKPLFNELEDEKVKDEFEALTKINSNTLTSIIATANIALNPIAINDNLELLTSNHTIDFDKFRQEKSVIYIKIPAHKQKQYKFLLNIFYSQFFNHMMDTLPTAKDLPIYCLLDEFGNMNLPNFEITIATIRKYKISVSLILQDLQQIEKVYGSSNVQTIISGGISSMLFYSGASLETTKMVSEILGYKDSPFETNTNEKVMRSDEIRRIKDDEALFIMSNLYPAKLKIKPYYKDFIFNQFSKIQAYQMKDEHKFQDIDFVDIYGE